MTVEITWHFSVFQLYLKIIYQVEIKNVFEILDGYI